MRLTIVSRRLRLSEAMRRHLARRAHFALGRFAAAIRAVHVSLSDENGPRGGLDKRCRVLVSAANGQPIIVEGRGDQVQPLVDDTLERAGRALARAVKRSRWTRGSPIT